MRRRFVDGLLVGVIIGVIAANTTVKVGPRTREESNMPKVYLSGPMRGYPKFNFPAFDEAAKDGRDRGFFVISPADLDREIGHNEDDLLEDVNVPAKMRLFAKRDCEALISLRAEDGDAIALLPGWEKSTGAVAEVMLAKWLGLRVLNAQTWEPFTVYEFAEVEVDAITDRLMDHILGD